MGNMGIKVSVTGVDVFKAQDRELSWSSEFYQHSIEQTKYYGTTTANQVISHGLLYIPILLTYGLSSSRWSINYGDTGVSSIGVKISTMNSRQIRNYLFQQNV